MNTKRLTIPAEIIVGFLMLGITIQVLGLIFLLVGGQTKTGMLPADVVGERLLIWGGMLALALPATFIMLVLTSMRQTGSWFKPGRYAPASWISYWSEDNVLRYRQGRTVRWQILAYLRARFMALDVELSTPKECGVHYTVLDINLTPVLPTTPSLPIA